MAEDAEAIVNLIKERCHQSDAETVIVPMSEGGETTLEPGGPTFLVSYNLKS